MSAPGQRPVPLRGVVVPQSTRRRASNQHGAELSINMAPSFLGLAVRWSARRRAARIADRPWPGPGSSGIVGCGSVGADRLAGRRLARAGRRIALCAWKPGPGAWSIVAAWRARVSYPLSRTPCEAESPTPNHRRSHAVRPTGESSRGPGPPDRGGCSSYRSC